MSGNLDRSTLVKVIDDVAEVSTTFIVRACSDESLPINTITTAAVTTRTLAVRGAYNLVDDVNDNHFNCFNINLYSNDYDCILKLQHRRH